MAQASAVVFGAHAYVLRDAGTETLLQALRAVARGHSYLDPRMAHPPFAYPRKNSRPRLRAEEIAAVVSFPFNLQLAGQLDVAADFFGFPRSSGSSWHTGRQGASIQWPLTT